jgi:hypothetical protein
VEVFYGAAGEVREDGGGDEGEIEAAVTVGGDGYLTNMG